MTKTLDSLDLPSLEYEHTRLQKAIQNLELSNMEIAEFIEQEQKDLIEQLKLESQSDSDDIVNPFEPDPEFMLAIEENKAVIEKYSKTCSELMLVIQRKRGSAQVKAEVTDDSSNSQDEPLVYLNI
ncbi:hypothetical protein BGZ76_006324 [Entomortierella beljakovae]|nr:hypothetical protein BGZ76_006324 [Entomortierella beljakovae]